MVEQRYRWDFIGLSTDTKPTPAESEKVVDGSTYYCADNSKLYVFYGTEWYEKTVSGGGGGGDITDVTVAGTSVKDGTVGKIPATSTTTYGAVKMGVVTQAEYDALVSGGTVDPETYYMIEE